MENRFHMQEPWLKDVYHSPYMHYKACGLIDSFYYVIIICSPDQENGKKFNMVSDTCFTLWSNFSNIRGCMTNLLISCNLIQESFIYLKYFCPVLSRRIQVYISVIMMMPQLLKDTGNSFWNKVALKTSWKNVIQYCTRVIIGNF